MLIRKNEVMPYYRKCSERLNIIYEFLKTQFEEGYVDDLCELRGYVGKEQYNLLQEMQIGVCSIESSELGLSEEDLKDLGLVNKNGEFLLNDRYIVPILDVGGNVSALVGYYPDVKKYITTPSPYFSKATMFFNFKQAYELSWSKFDGLVFVVEGIFDTLSMRSIGLPCLGCMGVTLSKYQGELLKLFRRVIAIPDDDKAGKQALNRYSKYGWKVPSNTTMLNVHGGVFDEEEGLHVKDMDNFISWYDADSVREILLGLRDCRDEVEDLYL